MASHRRKQRKLNKKSKCYKATGYNRHHRKPKSLGGRNNPENISIVLKRHHQIFNELFGSAPTPWEVAQILSDVWIDPSYKIIVIKKGGNMIQCPVCCTPMSKDGKEYTCICGVTLVIGERHEDNSKDAPTAPPEQCEPAQSITEVSSEEDCHMGHA